MEEAGTAAGANPVHEVAHRLVERLHVVAVDLDGGDPEALGARPGSGAAGDGAGARGRGERVVLAHEEHRKVEDARPVQAFEEGTAVDRAVAEDAGDDARAAEQLHPVRRARRNLDVGADHAVRAEHPDAEVGDVHRPALAAAAPALAAEQLAHHRLRVRALDQRMAVSAVGGEQQIVALEVGADARGARLLADRRVQRAGNEPVLERRQRGLLERAHAPHVAEVPGQALGVDVGAVHARRPPMPGFSSRARPASAPQGNRFARAAAFRYG